MDNRVALISFIMLILIFIFAVIFGEVAIAEMNAYSAILAAIGYIATIAASIIIALSIGSEGSSMTTAFFILSGLGVIIFVWFLSRGGCAMGIW
ncbi:MAG: hypothetical protein K9L68_06445 [Spirochaetales bacterium]|nr:hypothetical protein [Spirochaetales bacterium]MCF7938222.1 hypothetical protein [Spirochaetales bacterium]